MKGLEEWNLSKKSIPTGKGARHIDDDKSLPIFSKEVETLDLGRSDFQRNSFKIKELFLIFFNS